MHIRPAKIEDVNEITALGQTLLSLHFSFDHDYYLLEENFQDLFSKWIQEQIASSWQFILVAEESGNIVGFISGFLKTLYPWFKTKKVGHISYLVIDQKYQNKGIGKALQEKAMEWFKKKETRYIEVYVDEKNLIGHKAWTSYNFASFKKFLRKKL